MAEHSLMYTVKVVPENNEAHCLVQLLILQVAVRLHRPRSPEGDVPKILRMSAEYDQSYMVLFNINRVHFFGSIIGHHFKT